MHEGESAEVKGKTKGSLLVFALAMAVAVVSLFSRGFSAEIVYPLERMKALFSRHIVARVAGMWRGAAALAENRRLRAEAAALAMDSAEIARLCEENAKLRALLGYREKLPGCWIAAEVLSRDGAAAARGRTLRVDKGTLAGVKPGSVVACPAGLVGKVASASLHTAEVLLITDPSVKVACQVAGIEGAAGILAGGTDERLLLRFFRDCGELPACSKVFTSGRGGVYPAGIEVGVMVDTFREGPEALREGKVQPAVDFPALEDVFIRCEK